MRAVDDHAAVFAEASGRWNEQLMDQVSGVELVVVDEAVLDELVAVATTDAAPDEVTPPLGEGWTPDRVEWLRAFHRLRRTGFAGGEEETAAIRVGGRIVGAVRLHRSSPQTPDALESGIWLAASWRGRGLSAVVLRLIAERAAAIGASRLTARTTATNAPAIAALRRAGAIIRHDDDRSVYAEILLDDRRP
nr:GNAT family N-acetyltransferase [Brevibacterium daeguense]